MLIETSDLVAPEDDGAQDKLGDGLKLYVRVRSSRCYSGDCWEGSGESKGLRDSLLD